MPTAPIPEEEEKTGRPRWQSTLLYGAMIAATIAGFLIIRHFGRDLVAPPSPTPLFATGEARLKFDALMHVLLALAVVIVTARALGLLFSRFGQPPVIGEVIAGILLGPSLLGRVAPGASAYLLPSSVAPFLAILSQVGVILYMFLVGLELDTSLLRRRTHATVAVSHASIMTPFLLGAALALLLYPRVSSSDVPFTYFALFCGVAMSVTAFPVLARILTDRKQHTSRMGVIALTCAAVDDVTAWCLLAFVVSVASVSRAGAAGGLMTAALTLAYIAFMLVVARPVITRLIERHERQKGGIDRTGLTIVFVGLLFSALVTEFIGIHAIFGAFALGAVIPAGSRLAGDLIHRLEDFVVVLFLPAFFAYTGLRTQIGLVSGADEWLMCALVVLVACLGKFGGSFVAGRATGLGWQDAASLGVLMNTRGLMELIVLNIGLDLRIISPTLFAMLVIMAVVTTFATTPLLQLIEAIGKRGQNAGPQPTFGS